MPASGTSMSVEHTSWASAETSGGVTSQAAHPERGQAIGQRRAQNAQHADHAGPIGSQRVGAHQHADPGDAQRDAAELRSGERLAREHARHHQREQRGGCIQHRGEAAGDPGLAVDDEAERDKSC